MGDKNYFRRVIYLFILQAFRINTQDPNYFWKHLLYQSKCSAFIKLIKDTDGNVMDLYSGHATWSDFSELIRTYKQYKTSLIYFQL